MTGVQTCALPICIRTLAALKSFGADDARRVSHYLLQSRQRQASVIDVVSWLYSALMVQAASGIDVLANADPDWPQQLAKILEGFRTADGGYAKTREGAIGSTYHSFLVALCFELIGQSVPSPELLVKFIHDRQRDDGGFVEIAPMKRSGTNPTAAAVAVLTLHSTIGKHLREDVLAFLKDVRSDEGGFQANSRIPFADTLSTFTGYLTCLDLEERTLIAPRPAGAVHPVARTTAGWFPRRGLGSIDRRGIHVLRAGGTRFGLEPGLMGENACDVL